jgi:serine/threonine protein kinase
MIISGKYKLLKKIGNGSFGTVFLGESLRTKRSVAIKVEYKSKIPSFLKREAQIYQYLGNHTGIIKVKNYGSTEEFDYIVLPLLGKPLSDTCLSNETVVTIAMKIINIIEYIHLKGLIHRDLKPDNFLFDESDNNQIYLIDFGLAKKYIDNESKHIPFKTGKSLVGSINYSSINVQQGIEASRRDDMESILYITIFLLKKDLPWENCYEGEVLQKKKDYNEATVKPLLQYCRNLKFEEKPNYSLFYEFFTNPVG